jgi:hypothetical protein
MASWQELVNLTDSITEDEDVTTLNSETTIGDYAADIVRAPVAGVSRAIQGLLQLGAIPVDYLANTNLTSKIDELFNKYTPDAKTGVGELVQTVVQFGVPLGVASKIGSGIKALRAGTNITKLSSPELVGVGAKATELVKRAGYFGAIGGVTDVVASVPGYNKTISETFGLEEESPDLDSLEGKERAAEMFKKKIQFGAEGATISGAIPMLPVAGTLGAKFLGAAYGKVIAPVGKQAFRALDSLVVNPLSTTIAGKGETGGLASLIIKKGGDLLDAGYGKLKIPDAKEWKYFDSKAGTLGERILKKLDNAKNNFTTAGIINPALKAEGDKVAGKIESEIRKYVKTEDRINETLYNTVSKFKVNIFDKLTKSPGYRNIMDSVQAEKNKIFDYLNASTKKDQTRTFNLIDKSVRNEARELKNILKESNTKFGNLLSKSKSQSHKDLANLLINDADNFFKQRFASFNNAKFAFDEKGEVAQGAIKELKNIILKNKDLRDVAGATTSSLDFTAIKNLSKKIQNNKTLTGKELEIDKEITAYATNRLGMIKKAVINAGGEPNLYFNNIAKIIRNDLDKLRPGESFPDAIKRFLSTPKGQKVEIKDYSNALLDTITYNAKQVYKNKYFDVVENEWLKNGVIFKNEEEAIAKGIDPTRLRQIKPIATTGVKPTDAMFESNLFKSGYWTLPEISNAVLSTKTQFDNFFDNAFYSNLMQLKAGAQIAKTIFSPMTQIRNVTTASFFPLASGLIGTRSSLGDAFKLVADDIFTSAKTNLESLTKEIDDMVTRGVIDQNIQVNEIKNIMDQASSGKISFNSFMNNATVKKFVDVYQGGDNIWKIYSDRFYRSALKEAFGDPKATPGTVLKNVKEWYRTVAKDEFIESSAITGGKKSADDALKEVSAYLVTNTIPTYSKVPKIIQELRKLPLGNFVAFPAEILRTSANLLTIGARELTSTNPFIRQMGARRLIGASMTFGGIGAVVQKTSEQLTGVTEDLMDRAKRSFVPIYEKNSTLIPMSAPDENGNFKYINFSYSNPYDALIRPFNTVVNAIGNGRLNKDSVDSIVFKSLFGDSKTPGALSEFFAPFITESIGTERVGDIAFRGGETRTGKKIFFPGDPLQTKIARGLEHIIGGLEPGAFTQARRVWEGATGTFTDAGTERNTKDELMAIMSGVRIQEIKPLASMPFIVTSFGKDKENINNKFSRLAYSTNTSPEQKISAFAENIQNSFISQKRLYQTIQDAEELGVSTREIRNILQDRLKNETDVSNLMRGKFKAPNYSRVRYDSLIRRLEIENPEASIVFEDTVRDVMDIYDDIKKDLRNYDLDGGVDELNNYVDEIISPSVPEIRSLPTRLRAPVSGITTPGPKAELPSQVSGTPINAQVVSAPLTQQNLASLPLGERYNILFG